MKLHPYQQRLIREWFKARRKGKQLELPDLPGLERVMARIREIELANRSPLPR